ncbi:MAG: hypothetical protein QXN26_04855 [Thermoplasmataceae archaeon]
MKIEPRSPWTYEDVIRIVEQTDSKTPLKSLIFDRERNEMRNDKAFDKEIEGMIEKWILAKIQEGSKKPENEARKSSVHGGGSETANSYVTPKVVRYYLLHPEYGLVSIWVLNKHGRHRSINILSVKKVKAMMTILMMLEHFPGAVSTIFNCLH